MSMIRDKKRERYGGSTDKKLRKPGTPCASGMLSVKELLKAAPSGFPVTHRKLHTGNWGRLPSTWSSHSR